MGRDDKNDHAFTREERTIGIACFGVASALVLFVGVLILFAPGLAASVASFILINVLFGREPAMAVGAAFRLPPWLMIVVNVLQSLSLGGLVFLLFLRVSRTKAGGFLGRWMDKTRRMASRHRRLVARLGPPGLFLLMLIPFVGRPYLIAIAGHMGDLGLRQILIPIAAATVVVAAAWAYTVTAVVALLADAWADAGIAIAVALTAIAVTIAVVLRRRKVNRRAGRTTS